MYYSNGKPVFTNDTFWEEPSDILDRVVQAQVNLRLDNTVLREIARSDPWRTIWVCRKGEGVVFGVPPVDYTEEQRSLVGWSGLYDNIYEHSDCPPDAIIEDDDMLDGWLIDQRQQREKRQNKQAAEEIIGNEKIRGSQEIFFPAQTIEDAARVNELNDENGKRVLRQRFGHLKQKGVIAEEEMPNTKQSIRAQQAKMMQKG